MTAPSTIPLSPDPLSCLLCGYDLRGLTPTSACPECNLPVADSIRGNGLRYSSLSHLWYLHHGVLLLLASSAVVILMWFAMMLFGSEAGRLRLSPGGRAALMSVYWCSYIPYILGWWWLTTPDRTLFDRGGTTRKVARISIVIWGGLYIVAFLASFVFDSRFTVSHVHTNVIGFAAIAVWLVHHIASMLYIRWLARRIPDERLEQNAARLMWILPLLYTLSRILALLHPIFLIGTLIGEVLYWNMLNALRRHTSEFRAPDASSELTAE